GADATVPAEARDPPGPAHLIAPAAPVAAGRPVPAGGERGARAPDRRATPARRRRRPRPRAAGRASRRPARPVARARRVCHNDAGERPPCGAARVSSNVSRQRGRPMTTPTPGKGLEDVVVSTSEICFIDGDRGRLLYRGYDIHDLVAHSSFEETAYLLWYGSLPSRAELERTRRALATQRRLPPKILTLLRSLPRRANPMDVLRTVVSALGLYDIEGDDASREANLRRALRIQAQVPTIVAAWGRLRRGKAPVPPNPRLSLAANLLYMLSGRKPTPLAARAMDTALILHADHELNAS